MSIDLLSISGHKIYGPKGVGALYVRRRPRARIAPLIDGGGQERGMRSGTLPTPLCVGLGEAAAIARAEMAEEAGAAPRPAASASSPASAPRVPEAVLNGDPERRLPGNLNLSFPGRAGARADGGLPGPGALDRLGLHRGRDRAVLCAAGAGAVGRRWRRPRSASASAASPPSEEVDFAVETHGGGGRGGCAPRGVTSAAGGAT